MKVHEIMSEPVVTCVPEASLAVASRLMREKDCGMLPVVDAHGRLAGVITDRDICLAVGSSGRNAGHIAVHEVMTRRPVAVTVADTVHTALATMKGARVRRLPVLDTFGHLKGLLSMDDVFVRGLEARGIGTDEIVLALRSIYERRPVAVEA